MNDNPYAPPRSPVGDTSPTQKHEARPGPVVLAVRLAALNYALGLVVVFATWGYFSGFQSTVSMIATQIFSSALVGWIYYKIYVGRNWARITLLVCFVLGSLITLKSMVIEWFMDAPLAVKVQTVVGLVINLVILWLLFISPGRHWFRRVSNRSAALHVTGAPEPDIMGQAHPVEAASFSSTVMQPAQRTARTSIDGSDPKRAAP